MSQLQPDGFEWFLPEQIKMIAEGGFDGVDLVYGDFDFAEIRPLLNKYRLESTVTVFPESIEALQPVIEIAQSLGVRHLNIIGKFYPFSVNEDAKYIRGWMALCNEAGLAVTIETHRDCIIADMHYALQLMEQVPEMHLCIDLSHFVVGRKFSWPITAQVKSQIESILDRSTAFQ